MEFIIIGLFILFFSYILLYSLYDIYFKSYGNIVEGLTAEEKATEASNQSDSANSQIEAQNAKHPNATFRNVSILNNKPT
jgi:hypothetical protein